MTPAVIMLHGRGAGPEPTGVAVVSDLMRVAREIRSGSPERVSPFAHEQLAAFRPVSVLVQKRAYYLRFRVHDRPGIIAALAGLSGLPAEALQERLGEWTAGQDAHRLAEQLQDRGARFLTLVHPTAVVARNDSLIVLTGKGRGTKANPDGPRPGLDRGEAGYNSNAYTLGQTSGTVLTSTAARASGAELDALSARVARANHWGEPRVDAVLPPFENVIYIVKENRTYDQIFGDLPQADGDTSLVFFPRAVSPNHHALAERFGIMDRFFVNAEVSPDGHNWSMAAYTTDYTQKTVPQNYSRPSRGRSYDWEGQNRNVTPADDEDVAEPANGYLWNLAQRANVSFRNYGEFVKSAYEPKGAKWADVYADYTNGTKKVKITATPNMRSLDRYSHPNFPGFPLTTPDVYRAKLFIDELKEFEKKGAFPNLTYLFLPADHTNGTRPAIKARNSKRGDLVLTACQCECSQC